MTKPRTTKTFGELVMECFEDHILQILIAAAAVSLIVGVIQNGWQGLIEGTSILISILIITAVTSINNYVKER
jgi:P-type Ca2+ transporter type 2B